MHTSKVEAGGFAAQCGFGIVLTEKTGTAFLNGVPIGGRLCAARFTQASQCLMG